MLALHSLSGWSGVFLFLGPPNMPFWRCHLDGDCSQMLNNCSFVIQVRSQWPQKRACRTCSCKEHLPPPLSCLHDKQVKDRSWSAMSTPFIDLLCWSTTAGFMTFFPWLYSSNLYHMCWGGRGDRYNRILLPLSLSRECPDWCLSTAALNDSEWTIMTPSFCSCLVLDSIYRIIIIGAVGISS